LAKIQVQGMGMYDDKTLKKKIIQLATELQKNAKSGNWNKASENGIRALGRMWGAYQDYARENESVNEADDHEGKMAKAQLERSMEYAKMIYKIIQNVGDGGEVSMPAWVQSKLTKSMDYLQSVYNYLDGKDGLDDKFQENK
jgi:hypothetical protein|tara:strand:- start:232 stop:657 length:426 start_codon:yes stop_codon:yes gene_type:complete